MSATIEALSALAVPGPIPTSISAPFWRATELGRFELQRCDDCEQWVFYPRSHCPHCWGRNLTWTEASGQGALKSWSVVHRPGHAAWKAVAPYVVALVELTEGPTMLSQVLLETSEAEDLYIGMPLEVRLVTMGKFTLPMFTASSSGAS